MSRKPIMIVAAVCALALLSIGVATRSYREPQVTYRFTQVERSTLTSTVSAAGNIIADQQAAVSAQISGTITAVYVRQGQAVQQGDVLYELSSPHAAADVANAYDAYVEAKSAVESSYAGQLEAETQRDTIHADQASSQGEKNTANQRVMAAQTAVQAARQHQAALWLSYTTARDQAAQQTVRAPITGTVTNVSARVGAQAGSGSRSDNNASSNRSASSASNVSNGDVIIQDLSSTKVQVSINEVDVAGVAVGQPAVVAVESLPDAQLHGTVERLDANGTTNQGVVGYQAIVKLDHLDGRLRPGMTSSARITIQSKQNVLKVPISAVHKAASDGHQYVESQTAEGRIIQHTVKTGMTSDTEIEITEGLTVGQRIVTQTIQPTTHAGNRTANPLTPTTSNPKASK